MRIAITGGTGFVGSHLAARLRGEGVEVVTIGRAFAAIDDVDALSRAFAGCDAVAHCAGINRELGTQTYERVHVGGTRAVVEAARRTGVRKIVFMSFLRARPDCGSAYHESKWASEELVRGSGLDYTIVKAGMTYGRGDHMLDHLSHALHTFPIFLTVGFREKPVRPLAIEDLVEMLRASLVDGRLSRQTIAITGAEEMTLSDAVRRVARVVDAHPLMLPAPVWLHAVLARVWEWTMKVPLAARAQVQILSEGVVDAVPFADALPDDLVPRRRFTDDLIRAGLPAPGRFGIADLRCSRVRT
ncbi:MAG TPA: NAD-dependent epimerase/dehydratase family protein [Thermoanaerobaculia bacterium]|jgi:NADH dehydrogenase|nr:NAD-dependent epimerase/dehydratase family protein [Thermoanaerobaculia bacterium]